MAERVLAYFLFVLWFRYEKGVLMKLIIRPNRFIPHGPKLYMIKFLTAVLAFFPLFSMSAIAPHTFTQSKNKNSYQYVTLIRDNELECVSSLTGKTHLLPDFVSAPVEEKGGIVLFDQGQSPDPALATFPVCSKEQENFISLSSQKMTEKPLQTAGYWMLALGLFKLTAYGINCFTSFKAGEYGYRDPAAIPYGIAAIITTLIPSVSLKSPLVCAGAGTVIGYFTGADLNSILLDSSLSQGSRENEHPYLNSVVTVYTTFKISDIPFPSPYEILKLFEEEMASDDSTVEEEAKGETKPDLLDGRFFQVGSRGHFFADKIRAISNYYAMQSKFKNNVGNVSSASTEEETKQDFFDDRFFQASLGSGFFVDKDKVITNYHVIRSKFRKNEYEAKYVIELADGTQTPVQKILAQDEKRDLALLQTVFPVGTPVRLGDSDKLNLLDEVVVAGTPWGLKNSLTKGHISQVRGEDGKGFIQYTAPTSQGNSGGALFLEDSHELIGVPTMVDLFAQNLNFAIPVNDVKKFLKENGY